MSAPGPRTVTTAAALVIGGELLSGKIQDQNIYPLAQTLRALGIRLERIAIVPDELEIIASELNHLRSQVDVVFTSGGVGPTHDDVSVQAVARALGRRVVLSPTMERLLEEFYGDAMTETHRLMARVPEGAELISTADLRWPTVSCDSVWMFPGVPELFRMKLAALRYHLRGPAPIFGQEVLSSSPEIVLKDRIDQIVARFPDVSVGSYPKWLDAEFKTRVTFDGSNQELVHEAAEEFMALLGDELVRVPPT